MERFVQCIAVGGVALVAGLWLVAYAEWVTPLWGLGAALGAVGTVGLLYGTGMRVEGMPPE